MKKSKIHILILTIHLVKDRVCCWSLLTNLRHQGREGAALFVPFRLLRHQAVSVDTAHPFMGLRYQPEIAGTFLSLIEPEPNYDHVLFSIDNHYLIIQLVTQTQPYIIPTILGFRERSTLASSCPAQPVVVKFLSDQDFILPALSLSHVVYGEFEYQRNSLRDEKDLNESGITPNKVI